LIGIDRAHANDLRGIGQYEGTLLNRPMRLTRLSDAWRKGEPKLLEAKERLETSESVDSFRNATSQLCRNDGEIRLLALATVGRQTGADRRQLRFVSTDRQEEFSRSFVTLSRV